MRLKYPFLGLHLVPGILPIDSTKYGFCRYLGNEFINFLIPTESQQSNNVKFRLTVKGLSNKKKEDLENFLESDTNQHQNQSFSCIRQFKVASAFLSLLLLLFHIIYFVIIEEREDFFYE